LSQTLKKWKIKPYMSVLKLLVGWFSWESRWINSFHNFLSFNHSFRKHCKLVHRKNVVVIFNHWHDVLLFSFMRFWVWGILQRWSAWVPTTHEVIQDFQKLDWDYHRSEMPSYKFHIICIWLLSFKVLQFTFLVYCICSDRTVI
jgi:hypothetical protein